MATFEEDLRLAEYAQINEHLRNLYSNALRLAQLSMVVNPALGVAFAYVWKDSTAASFPGRPVLIYLLAFIAGLAFCYNFGALAMHNVSAKVHGRFVNRLQEIEGPESNIARINTILAATAPALSQNQRPRRDYWLHVMGSADFLTKAFFFSLMVGWVVAGILAVYLP
jgi:hypothetical protein